MAKIFKGWGNKLAVEQILPQIEQWFECDNGERFLEREQQFINRALGNVFGYHLLQLSINPKVKLYEDSRVQTNYQCHPYAKGMDAICLYDQLPFASESLDAVILHHAHEFVEDPHHMLREVQRVVIPQGHLIILGFNPVSPRGIYTMGRRLFPNAIWLNHMIRCGRMKDWLGLLGFSSYQVIYGSHMPKFIEQSDKAWMDKLLERWPLGNFYMIAAKKQVASVIPSKPKWKVERNNYAGLSPIKPTTSGPRIGSDLAARDAIKVAPFSNLKRKDQKRKQ